MNNGGLSGVEILNTASNIQHEAEHSFKRRGRNIALQYCQLHTYVACASAHNIIEQVSILAKLAHEHARDLRSVLGNADASLHSQSVSSR